MSRCQRECHRFEPDILLHNSVLSEMDIILVFETSGGSSILSGPANREPKEVDFCRRLLYSYNVVVSKSEKLSLLGRGRGTVIDTLL